MPTRGITRRALLDGLAGGGALAPFVPLLETHAAANAPRRLIILHHPNGVNGLGRWRPVGTPTERIFTLPAPLSPLEACKQDIIFVDGIRNFSSDHGTPGGHSGSEPEILTGCVAARPEPRDKSTTRATGPSVDQVIAKVVGSRTRFDSLRFGVRNGAHRGQDEDGIAGACVVYSDAYKPLLPESDPYAAFDRIFGSFEQVAGNVGGDPVAAGNDVLDLVAGALKRLRPKLSAADRPKMDGHLDGIDQLRKTLKPGSRGAGANGSCAAPGNDLGINWQSDIDIRRTTHAQMDIMVAALACDLTRVATFQLGNTAWTSTFSWLGHTNHHHDCSHMDFDAFGQILSWTAGEVFYLLDRLKKIPEPGPAGNTMLDNTVLMWTSEFGDGSLHSTDYIPVLLAGGAGGFWKTGRYLSFLDESDKVKGPRATLPHNNVLLTLCHAMGLGQMTSFGDARMCTGPVAGLG